MSPIKNLIVLIIFIVALASCSKHRARQLAGTYHVIKNHTYWQQGSTPMHSTWEGEWEIFSEGTLIIADGFEFEADSLKDGNSGYSGYPSDYATLRIIDDSVFFYETGGGLGGGSTTSIKGVKIK